MDRVNRNRLLLFVAGLAGFGVLAGLWALGWREIYGAVFRTLGVAWFPMPFVDTHYLFSVAECHRRGIDVLVENPCDVLGRVFDYSPLWLVLARTGVTVGATPWAGTAIALAFLAGFAWLSNARSGRELAVYLAALCSSTVVFALERGNNDVVVFVLLVLAGKAFGSGGRPGAYPLILLAALLKYYPIGAMAVALHERRGRFLAVAAVATVVWGAFLYLTLHQLAAVHGNIPYPSFLGDAFGSANLAEMIGLLVDAGTGSAGAAIGDASWLHRLLIAAGVLASFALYRDLRRRGITIAGTATETGLFAIGVASTATAFFLAKNIPYRGIMLLLVLPLLVRNWRQASAGRTAGPDPSPPHRGWFLAVMAILALLWFEGLRWNAVLMLGEPVLPLVLALREMLWWGSIVGLLALLWLSLAGTPVAGPALRRLAAAPARAPAVSPSPP